MSQTQTRIIVYIPETAWVKGKGHRVSMVEENKPGHSPSGDAPEGGMIEPWYWGDGKDEAKSLEIAQRTARAYNQKRGISTDDEAKILLSSMRNV